MNVQVFGTKKSQDTKKALRFFKERGLTPVFVDLQQREIAPGELKRFVQRFSLDALVDAESKAYADAGLEYLRLSDEALMDKLMADPKLMKQPLLRSGSELAIGWNEAHWRTLYEASKKA